MELFSGNISSRDYGLVMPTMASSYIEKSWFGSDHVPINAYCDPSVEIDDFTVYDSMVSIYQELYYTVHQRPTRG